jgi:hypothetical protein
VLYAYLRMPVNPNPTGTRPIKRVLIAYDR